MSCKIEEMSWKEIIETYGIYILKDDSYLFLSEKGSLSNQRVLSKLLGNYEAQAMDGMLFKDQIVDYLEENEDCFDKVKYVMLVNMNCAILLSEDLDKSNEELKKRH